MEEEKMQSTQPLPEAPKKTEEDWFLPRTACGDNRPLLSPNQMYEVGRKFSERIFTNPDVAPKMRKSGIIVCMQYCDERWEGIKPEVTVDTTQDPIRFYTGPCGVKPNVIMRMHGDTAHRFWMRKLNMMIAITKGLIKVKGSIPAIMKMLPVIKPSFAIYKEVLAELGYKELLEYP